MALVLGSDLTGMQLSEKIAATAAGKYHKLAAYMVDGQHPVTPAAADSILNYLVRCPDKASRQEETVASAPAPRESRPRPVISDIPAGFYATPSATGNNDYDFWKVTVSKKGFRSVKRVLGGGSSQLPALVEIQRQPMAAALGAILRAGIQASADLYADLESRCSDCGRQLTDEVSRQARKGPICREKNG